MKKHYITKFIIICLFFSVKLSAQLNGVYTINNALATGGNNYNTFTAFATAINAVGVSGPVIVNVNPTTPYVEQVNFTQATGVSATNTITINGNGATLTWANGTAALPHTLMLSGADRMFFNNLNVSGTQLTYAMVIHLWNNADYNTFTNCSASTPVNNSPGSLAVPLSVSGNATSPTATGLGGNYNTFDGCQFISGYYTVCFYANTAAPFQTGNVVKNCIIRDSYYMSIYHAYTVNSTFKNNIIDNLNRNLNLGTRYVIYFTSGSLGCMFDGNHIRNIYLGYAPGNTTGTYACYVTAAATTGSANIFQNNIISNINNNGLIYGFYSPSTSYSYNHYYHNTVALDDLSSTSTGVTQCFNIYSNTCNVRNNIATIGRGGSGAKHCYYFGAVTSFPSSYNVSYISAPAGTNYAYFYTANYATLGALLGVYPLVEPGSITADPMYNNPTALDFVPTSTVTNNLCPFVGVLTDQQNVIRSTAFPDPGALESYTVPCVGNAPANSVATPTGVLCQNSSITVGLANTFTNSAYTVQWQMATSSILGPYTAIPNASLSTFNTNTLTQTAYFNAIITCANGGQPVTAVAGSVQIALPIIDNVTYNEGFEGISKTNQLPNCSWAASSSYTSTLTYTTIGTNNRIPHNGTKFASFFNSPAGSKYFYTNGINLYTGITYSASVWYINEAVGYNSWSDFSILVGTTQSPNGLIPVATTTVSAVTYTTLSGTFTVNTSGLYFVCIRATTGAGSSPYLSWDDLKVEIPCQIAANAPPINLNVSATTICSGQPVVLTASGASSYSWAPTNALTAQIAATPSLNTTYTVYGTNAINGCVATIVQPITVVPSPPVVLFASNPNICEGQSTNITAQGANSYNWSTGVVGQNITVSPLTSTSYSVIGVNLYGCPTLASIVIAVNTPPNVSATVANTLVCKGDNITFIGNGAATYQWSSGTALTQIANPLTFIAQSSGGYTLTGIDANGCAGTAFFVLSVEECTGLNEISNGRNNINVYPNPNSGVFVIESNLPGTKSIDVYDVTGRNVFSGTMTENNSKVNISEMPNGVYTVKVKTGETTKYLKIIKAH